MNFEQIKAILWLRWRLTANQFVRGGALNAVLSVLILVCLGLGALASGTAGFFTGMLALTKATPAVLLAIWDGILFVFLIFWMIGLLVEVQRSESIDIARLLHLPVTPSQVFVFNYVASHLTPSLILFLPGMLGLCAGMTLGVSPLFVLAGIVVVGFVFMVTSWTYCLRGWLASLMSNKRRRRAVIVWITIGFVAVSQVPNLVVHSSWFRAKGKSSQRTNNPFRPAGGQLPEAVLRAHLLFPPGWVGYSAMALKEGNAWPAAGAAAAASLIGLLGVMRAYRLTLRFYQGVESGKGTERVRKQRPRPSGVLLVERSLPWLSDDTAALTLASFRGLVRAPELKMAFITPLVLLVVFGSIGFSRARTVPPEFVGVLAATAAAVLASFSFAPTMSNVFGLDRDGFRGLVLLPTPRGRVLLGKNLAFFPFVLGTAVLMLLLAMAELHTPFTNLLTGLLQVPSAFMLFCLVTNMMAIFAPYRFSPGTLQAKKPKPVVIFGNLLVFLATPILALPLAIPPGSRILFSYLGLAGGFPVSLLAAAVLLVVITLLYWYLLPVQGRLLQKREMSILREVTEENE